MRAALIISIFMHACVFVALVFCIHSSPRVRLPEKVYSVTLLNARGGPRGSGSARVQKSVTAVEVAKAPAKPAPRRAPAKPAPKVAVPKKTAKEKGESLAKADAKAKKDAKGAEAAKGTVEAGMSASATMEGAMAGTGAGDGSGITVDGAQFPFAYFLSAIERKVSEHWYSPSSQPGAGLTCVVYFRLKRDGTVEDVRGERSSGNDFFDRSAVRAVKSASPFPPLPRGFQDEFLGIHFTFVQKD